MSRNYLIQRLNEFLNVPESWEIEGIEEDKPKVIRDISSHVSVKLDNLIAKRLKVEDISLQPKRHRFSGEKG